MLNIQESVNQIKELIEDAIITGGVEGKNNLIRTQIPICMLHDAAKALFIAEGVAPSLVAPVYGEHNGEQKLAGFFKCKNQDICFNPNNCEKQEEMFAYLSFHH